MLAWSGRLQSADYICPQIITWTFWILRVGPCWLNYKGFSEGNTCSISWEKSERENLLRSHIWIWPQNTLFLFSSSTRHEWWCYAITLHNNAIAYNAIAYQLNMQVFPASRMPVLSSIPQRHSLYKNGVDPAGRILGPFSQVISRSNSKALRGICGLVGRARNFVGSDVGLIPAGLVVWLDMVGQYISWATPVGPEICYHTNISALYCKRQGLGSSRQQKSLSLDKDRFDTGGG